MKVITFQSMALLTVSINNNQNNLYSLLDISMSSAGYCFLALNRHTITTRFSQLRNYQTISKTQFTGQKPHLSSQHGVIILIYCSQVFINKEIQEIAAHREFLLITTCHVLPFINKTRPTQHLNQSFQEVIILQLRTGRPQSLLITTNCLSI